MPFLSSSGISALNIIRGGGATEVPGSLLLDLYPGAVGAWAFVLLRDAYGGACIRVRRSSDNAEMDIFFVGGFLDTVSLMDFVGAGSGYITIFYGQSLNKKNLTQTTAVNQPRIVNAGVLFLENGLPAIDGLYGGSFDIPVLGAASTDLSTFTVQNYSGNLQGLFQIGTGEYALTQSGATTNAFQGSNISSSYINGSVWAPRQRGVLYTEMVTAALGQTILSAFGNQGAWFDGTSEMPAINFPASLQFVVLYDSDQSANRTAIESNINSHYNIYGGAAPSLFPLTQALNFKSDNVDAFAEATEVGMGVTKLTLLMWVDRALGSQQTISCISSNFLEGWLFEWRTNNTIRFWARNNNAVNTITLANTEIGLKPVIAVYDGAVGVKLYVDGNELTLSDNGFNSSIPTATTQTLKLGVVNGLLFENKPLGYFAAWEGIAATALEVASISDININPESILGAPTRAYAGTGDDTTTELTDLGTDGENATLNNFTSPIFIDL